MPSQRCKFRMQLDSCSDISVILVLPLPYRKQDLINVFQYTRRHTLETNVGFQVAIMER